MSRFIGITLAVLVALLSMSIVRAAEPLIIVKKDCVVRNEAIDWFDLLFRQDVMMAEIDEQQLGIEHTLATEEIIRKKFETGLASYLELLGIRHIVVDSMEQCPKGMSQYHPGL